MKHESLPFDAVAQKIADAKSITILSHLNPDADTLGTSLGIYALLEKDKDTKVEVVNASQVLPMYLDFLPNFKKIKHQIEYDDSLIIACDCGSIDRLGFNLDGREIINIDHHQSNTQYGSINVVLSTYASASQVAYKLFDTLYEVNAKSATCFYTALLSDTRYFTTSSVNEEVFRVAQALVKAGALPHEIAFHFTQRRPLSSLRILEKALASLSLHEGASIATLMVTKEEIASTGASMPDMDGIVDYARSLVTVEIAIFAMELEEGIRISLRSKSVDVSEVAMEFGGGGHKVAAGFTFYRNGELQSELQQSMDTILSKIKDLGLINEK